nr:Scr1 family TA system antitoxin-like transcriptional regulator [Streptomyces sp. TRM68367]
MVVLEESVLHHHVGGSDLMSTQILHVLGLLAFESAVSVAVIPLHAARSTRQLPMEPFVIIDGHEVLLPIAPVPLLVEHRDRVGRYSSAFHRLRQIALTCLEAHEYLARLLPLPAPRPLDDQLEGRKLSCAVTV